MTQPIHSTRLPHLSQHFHILGILLLLFIGLPFIGTASSIVYVNGSSAGTVGGLNFTESDIIAFDPSDNTWSQYFTGSAVGITEEISGFHILTTGEILLTFKNAAAVPGVGTVSPSDIVKYPPNTGVFELIFDGSDVGLSEESENIDALAMLPNGNLIISTTGAVSATGASGADEDLLEFTGTLGNSTSGSFSIYFDGSDVGLIDENIEGVWLDPLTNGIYLSLGNLFMVGEGCGDASDILAFTGTSGTFSIFWDGSANGFTSQNVKGFSLSGTDLIPPSSPGPCEPLPVSPKGGYILLAVFLLGIGALSLKFRLN